MTKHSLAPTVLQVKHVFAIIVSVPLHTSGITIPGALMAHAPFCRGSVGLNCWLQAAVSAGAAAPALKQTLCQSFGAPGCFWHVWGRGRNTWMINSPPQCHTLHLPLPLCPLISFPFCRRNGLTQVTSWVATSWLQYSALPAFQRSGLPTHHSTAKTGASPTAPSSWQGAGWKSPVTMSALGCLIIPLPGPALSQQSTETFYIQMGHLKNLFCEPEQDTRLLVPFFKKIN